MVQTQRLREVAMIRKRSIPTPIGLAVLILIVGACGETALEATSAPPTVNTPTTTLQTTSTTTHTVTTTTLTTTATVQGEIVQVVFAAEDQSDCSNVRAVDRSLDETPDPMKAVFELLVAGPTTRENVEGAVSMFSNETAGMLRSVELSNGLLTVDFEDLRPVIPNASTSCGHLSLIAQLNGTAFQFPEVERVTYQIEGNCHTFFNWLQRECHQYPRP